MNFQKCFLTSLRSSRALLGLVCGVGVTLGGCATAADAPEESGSDVESSSEALRALAPGELRGSLRLGESVTVRCSGAAYCAYAVHVRSGQRIDATVQSEARSAQPMLWITDNVAASHNLAQDTNRAGTRAAHTSYVAAYRATSTAPYYVVVRNRLSATVAFKLTLGPAAVAPACDPLEEDCAGPGPAPAPAPNNDPFSPDACTGPVMTAQQARAMLPTGQDSLQVAESKVDYQMRRCDSAQGCGAWTSMPQPDRMQRVTATLLPSSPNDPSTFADGMRFIVKSPIPASIWSMDTGLAPRVGVADQRYHSFGPGMFNVTRLGTDGATLSVLSDVQHHLGARCLQTVLAGQHQGTSGEVRQYRAGFVLRW